MIKIIASWDDGSIQDMRMSELMNKYSIPTIFFIPICNIGKSNMLQEDDIKELSKRFEIGSHSFNHRPMNKMTIGQLITEIKQSKIVLENTTGNAIKSFAYPKNSENNLTRSLIKGCGYTEARASTPCWLRPGNDPFSIKCTVQIGIDRIEYKNKSWELFAKDMMARCDNNSTFHIFGNSEDVAKSDDWFNLESIIKEIGNI